MIWDVRVFCRGFCAVLPLQLRDWGWIRGWKMAALWAWYGVEVDRDLRRLMKEQQA